MIQNVALAGEIEIGVLSKIDDCGLIRRSGIDKFQRIVFGQRVNRCNRQRARIAFLAVLADVIELEGGLFRARYDFWSHDDLIESLYPAVKRVAIVVGRQSVFFPVEGELALGDAVTVTSDERAEIGGVLQIASEIVVAQDYIPHFSVPIWNLERDHNAPVVHDLSFRA